jgi:hypothetical protein
LISLGSERLFAPNPFFIFCKLNVFWFPALWKLSFWDIGNLSVSWEGECDSPLRERGVMVNFVPINLVQAKSCKMLCSIPLYIFTESFIFTKKIPIIVNIWLIRYLCTRHECLHTKRYNQL